MLSRQTRITLLLILDSVFFLIEIIIGYSVNSLALIADSFHMLNDVMSLIVALYAVKLASQRDFSPKYSYGWQRAEVLGALINGVFLLALCFNIVIEAIKRFFVIEVGSAGLLSNIIGLLLFHEHGHAGHDHSTISTEPTKDLEEQPESSLDDILVHPAQTRQSVVLAAQKTAQELQELEEENEEYPAQAQELEENEGSDELVIDTTANVNTVNLATTTTTENHQPPVDSTTSTNHLFLHVLGDALGNIGVIITALFIKYAAFSWRFYADPIVSLIITIIIFMTALPLGVPSVHELHIWQLSDTKRIASVHVLLAPSADYVTIAANIRGLLHAYGVHSTTIQPEFIKVDVNANGGERTVVVANPGNPVESELIPNEIENHEYSCLLRCSEDDSCAQNLCCPPPKQQVESPDKFI
ncbi:5360_t:CDS:2 [Diversispora eburnea]|uniref:5360_t:CDS:1 n=1 Tax=Diversispora eburnea TaxID=1213867 RepID=A0A9N8YIR0_9GLOM|nr:5360_t:CDS:2 [Diversispora eburnea]